MNQSVDRNVSGTVTAPTPGTSASPAPNLNIRRFVAENSRLALRQVRDALGGDAIILANRSIDGGVEVLAAAPEAVDALTRRMTAVTPSSQPLATPTELGLRRAQAPAAEAAEAASPTSTAPTVARKRLASLFSRRTQSGETATFTAKAVASPLAGVLPQAAAPASNPYARFADELADALGDDEDLVRELAPETVTLSRKPVAASVADATPAIATEPLVPTIVEAPAMAAAATPVDRSTVTTPAIATAVVDAVPAPVVEVRTVAIAAAIAPAAPATISAEDLNDVVVREVSREVSREFSREFGRDVINDLTRDVSREVSQAVTGDVVRDVSREVARDVTRDVTREVTRDVTRELRAMQATLTEQLSTLTWTDAMRRQPARTKLMQELILAGFSPALSRHIQERLPDDYDADEARVWAESILCRNLPVASDAEELINEGGVFALVGPTGVGKTTTVAKLAARFAMKHGVEQLALITTDGFRIGAQDQLRIYGKILGVAVHSIHDEASLTSSIAHFADKKLVLIDTAGLSQRDERVAEQIAMLRGAKARRLVVLNATVDAETLDHVVASFADRDFAGCVITKTDEAARLGPVLDAVIRHRLRIHHVSTGQKVPEDLERPDAVALVHRALTRPSIRPAFDVKADDEPVWMSAMAERANALSLTLDMTPSLQRQRVSPTSPSSLNAPESVHA